MQKTKIKAMVLLGFLLGNMTVASAAIDSNIRQQLPNIIQKQLCHSSLEYSMEDTFAEKKEKYHELINCLFNDAMAQSVNDMHRTFSREWAKIPSSSDFKDVVSKADKCSLKQVQRAQIRKGYTSLCPTEEDNPTVDKFYSACHVTETVMNEFCAYQEYLEWKIVDDFISEGVFESDTNQNFFGSDLGWSKIHKDELRKSKKVLYEMIYRYQRWEQQYRTHMWFTTILEGLKKTRKLTEIFRKAIYAFPDKFNFAASEICDQGC